MINLFIRVEIHAAAVDGIKMYLPRQFDVFMDYTTKNHFIECNYSQAKLFHETYGRDESDEAEIFRSRAWKLLNKAKTLLDRLEVPFWLSSGTCLGMKHLLIVMCYLLTFVFKMLQQNFLCIHQRVIYVNTVKS